jgi:TolA-binding protein
MLKKLCIVAVLLFLNPAAAVFLSAQSIPPHESLEQGIRLLGREEYEPAILAFRNLILDPAAGGQKADAWFWISKAYLATGRLEEAARSLELFLANYPDHPGQPEALYQKGRLLFQQADQESAIQVLQGFISRYPQSDYVPHAYYWVGESLFALGHLEEAARMYGTVAERYPRSFKVEAARYRLSVIDFKRRENELRKLLKWSHEESLRTIEEFQRREKTYEQALVAYQRKLQEQRRKEEASAGGLLEEVERLRQENASYRQRLEAIEPAPASGGTSGAATPDAVPTPAAPAAAAPVPAAPAAASPAAATPAPASPDATGAQRLGQLKEEALRLREKLLQRLEALPEVR